MRNKKKLNPPNTLIIADNFSPEDKLQLKELFSVSEDRWEELENEIINTGYFYIDFKQNYITSNTGEGHYSISVEDITFLKDQAKSKNLMFLDCTYILNVLMILIEDELYYFKNTAEN